MARDSIHPNTPGLDTSFADGPITALIPFTNVPLTTRSSRFSSASVAGSVIAALVDPFGSGSTFSTVGTVPAQLALSGANVVRGAGAVVAGTEYAITVLATKADGSTVRATAMSFRAVLPLGGTPITIPTPGLFTLVAAAALGMGAGAVTLPADLGWTPALGVTRAGTGQYGVSGSFASLKPAGVVLTVYVDPTNGNDSTGDGTAGSPFKTVSKAWMLGLPGYDTVEIVIAAAGLPANRAVWGDNAACPAYSNGATGHKNLLLRASDGGRVVLVAHGAAIGGAPAHYSAVPVWTPVSGAIYSTPVSTSASPFAAPIDFSAAARATQPNGEALGPVLVGSLAAITGPNLAFLDVPAGLLYYRAFDSRSMVGEQYVTKGSLNTSYGWNVSLGSAASGPKTFYSSACTFIGGSQGVAGNNNSPSNTTVYNQSRGLIVFADVCEFYGQAFNTWQANGGFDVYLDRDMAGYAGSDAMNPHNFGGGNALDDSKACHVFAYDSKHRVFTGYSFDHTNNVVTLHEDNTGVFVGGQYGGSDGRVIGFVNNARGVLYGPEIWPSSAPDASGFRTMLSASNQSVMDVFEPTIHGELSGAASSSIRTEAGARLRLHGATTLAITVAGLAIQSGSNILDTVDATSSNVPVAGPLRVSKTQCQLGATTRLRVLGVFPGATVTAALTDSANGTLTIGTDGQGTYMDVALASGAAAAPAFTLTHALAGVTSTVWSGAFQAIPAAAASPTVTISAAQSKAEGNGGATAYTYTVTRSASAGAVNVPWSFTAGTTSADDFVGGAYPAGGTVALADGVASGNFTIQVQGDATVEADESFTVSITPPTGYAAGASISATGAILTDDAAAVTPFVTDTFSALADNASLAGTTATTGGAWGTSSGGTIRGLSGAVYGPAGASIPHNAVPPAADYKVAATLAFVSAASAALKIRRTSASNFYFGGYDLASGKWVIGKNVAGTITQLFVGTAYAPANGDSKAVEMKAQGSTLTLTVDGAIVATGTDASFTAAGLAGLYFADASTTTAGVRVDNFAASALA